MEQILQRIRNARDRYDQCKLSLVADQTEILRELSVCYSKLSDYRIEYHEAWIDIYNISTGTNASKEREADTKVKELYMLRRTLESTKILIDTVRSTLSVAKNEK